MSAQPRMLEDEFPDLKAIIFPHNTNQRAEARPLRRSPRKNTSAKDEEGCSSSGVQLTLRATSNQRQISPAKVSPSERSPLKTLSHTRAPQTILDVIPILPRQSTKSISAVSAGNRQSPSRIRRPTQSSEEDILLASFSRLAVDSKQSDAENIDPKGGNAEKHKNRTYIRHTNQTTIDTTKIKSKTRSTRRAQLASQFILHEARCEEDLVDSDAHSEGENEDTDLSGFVVDDDAELSYHDSAGEHDSAKERRTRRRAETKLPRRRLQRGRKPRVESEDEANPENGLSTALRHLNLAGQINERGQDDKVEVIDLVSPDQKPSDGRHPHNVFVTSKPTGINLFDQLKALKLSPPRSSQITDIPSKTQSSMWQSSAEEDSCHEPENQSTRYTTPPTTPPRSPTKLKSPSKLLSPSKRGEVAQRSPHRQSMDAFWDLNEVNEWHDQFSPKKAPITSPRKNRLAALGIWSDDDDDDVNDSSLETMNESSDSLPSPCESPSKNKSRSASPIKVEKQRLQAEKRARQAEKKHYEETKEKMATDILQALDKNITDSRISKLAANTGGVQIIWSKTLRSTAGRANWRRTVTRPSGSPVKAKSEESAPGVTVQHYANIELAVKVIDRPDRLINTLAHEFCHLANFMVSGIRDQPHGTSFQNWARKVTKWMKNQDEVPEWKGVEVTTKHGYVIEWKYLWACVGRTQNRAMEILNIEEDEDGCGAEYGRHSKSIDVDTQRCGRCKGRLLQVRPKPRASPIKNKKRDVPVRAKAAGKGMTLLEKMVEVVELSD